MVGRAPKLVIAFILATGAVVLAATEPPGAAPQTFGDIARLVRGHDTTAKVELADVVKRPHAYGLGSLAGLRGEITILDGRAWLAYPPDGAGEAIRVVTAADDTEKAAFLVATYVDDAGWQKVLLRDALSAHDLDARLARAAREQALGDRSFVFRVEGTFDTLTLAVVDGRRLPPGSGTEASMKKANVLASETNAPGTLVGFYTPARWSPFTHERTHSHVHAIVPGKPATGHAQDFRMEPGAVLWLQAAPRRAAPS